MSTANLSKNLPHIHEIKSTLRLSPVFEPESLPSTRAQAEGSGLTLSAPLSLF
jgi:hypothetical protein